MKNKKFVIFIFAVIFVGSISYFSSPHVPEPPQSCTIATVSIGDKILFGNNEDFSLKGTGLWFVPSTDTKYGMVIFGYLGNWHPSDRFAQVGMNEMGLSCDANALSAASINRKPNLDRAKLDFFPSVLKQCATVNETIEWFKSHNFGSTARGQYHFADANGDAVIISAGKDGEWAFTTNEDSNYLLSTNFNVVNPENGWYPCWRYSAAEERLNQFAHEDNVTIENLKNVMAATVQEGNYATQYTNIFDPKTLDIYVWKPSNYSKSVELNLADELEGLKKTEYHKIPVLLGETDWFFPPQFPTFVAIGVGVVGLIVYIGLRIRKKRKAKKGLREKNDKGTGDKE